MPTSGHPTCPRVRSLIVQWARKSSRGASVLFRLRWRRALYNRWMKNTKRILVVDVGGSHVKFRIGPDGEIERFDSGPAMTARQMADGVTAKVARSKYDAVSIGYPGLVFDSRIAAAPFFFGLGLVGFVFCL